jgi:hypothetical protein
MWPKRPGFGKNRCDRRIEPQRQERAGERNILSYRDALANGNTITITSDGSKVTNPDGNIVLTGKIGPDNLITIDEHNGNNTLLTRTEPMPTVKLCLYETHKRLNHLDYSTIKSLVDNGEAEGIELSDRIEVKRRVEPERLECPDDLLCDRWVRRFMIHKDLRGAFGGTFMSIFYAGVMLFVTFTLTPCLHSGSRRLFTSNIRSAS